MSPFPSAKAVRGALFGIATLTCTSIAGAQSVATFNSLTTGGEGVRYVQNCYTEAQLRFTLVGVPCSNTTAFATWGPENAPFYSGSPALFNNNPMGTGIDITAAGGQMFSLMSIDLSNYLGTFGLPTTVVFTGMLMNGGMVTRTVVLPGATTTTTNVMFTDFNMLSSVRLTVTSPGFEPFVQFDNVAATVVPEPSTVLLLSGGLLAMGMFARRRRA